MNACVIGPTPKQFPFDYETDYISKAVYQDELLKKAKELIENGYTHFITPMNIGAELDFADIIIFLRDEVYPESGITLETVIAHPGLHKEYTGENWMTFIGVFKSSDKKTLISKTPEPDCYEKSQKYAIDNSDAVIAVWDGSRESDVWKAIEYASGKGKNIQYIMVDKLLESAYQIIAK